MGQVLDIVPNHMCVEDSGNAWWMDVLENGPSSTYAKFFDIDWSPVKKGLKDKVLTPVLGGQYGNVLEGQELPVIFEEGSFFAAYYEQKFPLRPQTYVLILEHRLRELESALQADSADLAEFLSIITALRHLPSYTETDPDRIAERYREKEVIKRRLGTRFNPPSRRTLKNVKLFNGTKETGRASISSTGSESADLPSLTGGRKRSITDGFSMSTDWALSARSFLRFQRHALIFRLSGTEA
jgi:(1->4)-alpha-D-glucan 1-alpha-D-glucosylmutase